MVTVKVSELSGKALDYAVAMCEGVSVRWSAPHEQLLREGLSYMVWCPSKDWAIAGPIIDSLKGFSFKQWLECRPATCCEAHIHNYNGDWVEFGPTLLIAAMRCYVASTMGDSVEIPDNLL